MNIKHSKKVITYISLVVLYIILFLPIYNLAGNLAGMIAIIFSLYISIKYKYLDVVISGIMMLCVNILIRILIFNDSSEIGITIFNYFVMIIVFLIILDVINKNRLIKKQYNEMVKRNCNTSVD